MEKQQREQSQKRKVENLKPLTCKHSGVCQILERMRSRHV